MRLKSVKLAGFKSFVDPTTIALPANLVGIVGPNGCGKSNIIDAVRWVLGETSAKNLRGDHMSDVIFSGSTGRKPVGKASVELVFDNSEGKAPGPYAQYAEISIRREVSRDGQSEYFLNKTKCRRKDITDLFLGTGLGPRAYSIIEQGMVTRIIEGKPEDLRAFVEEAAGVSRYKERRRETEHRIRHTRENLERVEDIRSELDTQLRRLQRQSKAAARYKTLKQEERQVHAELLALRWRDLGGRIGAEDRALAELENQLEARRAALREVEADLERLRQARTGATDAFNEVQGEFYRLGAEVANTEQAIAHARESREQRRRELAQAERALAAAREQRQADAGRIESLRAELKACGPRLAEGQQAWQAASRALEELEREKDEWQAAWEAFARLAAQPVQVQEVEGARIQQLEQHLARQRERLARLVEESGRVEQALAAEAWDGARNALEEAGREVARGEAALEDLERRLRALREALEERAAEIESLTGDLQAKIARRGSLEELQAAALGREDENRSAWLERRGLREAPRLSAGIQVAPGWELAVERVLGRALGSLCVPALDDAAADLEGLAGSELFLVEQGGRTAPAEGGDRLADKLGHREVDLAPLLAGIYVAPDLAAALARRPRLAPHESVITPAGAWVGPNWLSLADEDSAEAGALAREAELEQLQEETAALEAELQALRARQGRDQEAAEALEEELADARRGLQEAVQRQARAQSELARLEARRGQLQDRRDQLARERRELEAEIQREEAALAAAGDALAGAKREASDFEGRRQGLLQEKEALLARLEQARAREREARDAWHKAELKRENLETSLRSLEEGLGRVEAQVAELEARRAGLAAAVDQGDEPEAVLRGRLEELLEARGAQEQRLAEARQALAELEEGLRARERARAEAEQHIQEAAELLSQARVARQELVVRRETLAEQIGELGFAPEAVVAALPEEAEEEAWQARLEALERKIHRIGPVNLVAIEEFKEQSERKAYLDKQYDDLSRALATLEDAIRKIDRETRTRFKETFDKVNTSFQSFFPRLFGGGHAYLELTDDDLLSAGVVVMARPPGKRNSTIHLLSGGEKALTAVALMFAFFELNPAPFCILDEVDAPLDDANVERYCETLRMLAQRSQMIYITHNKISMESADILVGVTMAEPGVSRLVAVDLAQAVEYAAQ